ncbi:putative carboxylesterase 15 isoform X1 [Iris pallida]|uniref:Carboxylesterase 15 isoform X1 n=1 Tax=Iris pallida TaxID=29817 RepID=A0AAX6I1I0_IRIPA|nr:putative carboxylesterase 15 isoform X1 [Iris pallida]
MSPPPSAISNTTPSPTCNVVEDCAGLIKILSDGSILRSPDPLFPFPDADDRNDDVRWKQVIFDPTHNLRLRLYKPRAADSQGSKLPVLVYLHGGGFCFGSCSWPHLHDCCVRLASGLSAIVVAPDYRLAPEHRLPAAFEDGVAAVRWLRDVGGSDDQWLSGEEADLGNVIVMGDSSGGLIAHHLAVRLGLADARAELAPVRVSKYVLLGPFFGGVERTKSEADCPKDTFLNLALTDQFWRLALPVGADRDHPLVNPFGAGEGGGASLEPVEFEPTLVVVGECDLLRDRGVEYCERLKELGKPVELAEFEGQGHGFFTNEPSSESAIKLMRLLNKFVYNR